MNNSISCCGELVVKKLICNFDGCCSSSGDDDDNIMYTDKVKQVIILDAPKIDFKDFVIHSELDSTEIITFSNDENGNIRFVTSNGHGMIESEKTIEESIIGKKLEDVLPDYLMKFISPIYRQTLRGEQLQMILMWKGVVYLLRTYPIIDYKRNVISGTSVKTLFANDTVNDINRFSLNHSWANNRRMARPPDTQQMEPVPSSLVDSNSTTEITPTQSSV